MKFTINKNTLYNIYKVFLLKFFLYEIVINNLNYNYQKNAYKNVVINRTTNAGILNEESVSNNFLDILILFGSSLFPSRKLIKNIIKAVDKNVIPI